MRPSIRILSGSEDKVRTIIYFDNPVKRTKTEGFRSNVRLISYWDVISLGKKTANNNMEDVTAEPTPPTADTPAIIMYTSGSTGILLLSVMHFFHYLVSAKVFLFLRKFFNIRQLCRSDMKSKYFFLRNFISIDYWIFYSLFTEIFDISIL